MTGKRKHKLLVTQLIVIAFAAILVCFRSSINISAASSDTNTREPLSVKSLWASQHSVGTVLFKWSKKDGVTSTGWNLKYRFRKIGGNNRWSGWTDLDNVPMFDPDTYKFWGE